MNAVLARVAGFFYETRLSARPLAGASEHAATAAAPAVAVLAAPGDAMAAAAAIAHGLARRQRAAVVLVCLWSDGPDPAAAWRASASAAARRLAVTLAGRGHDAHARGRLVVVRLAEAEEDAVAECRRAAAAAGGAPLVVALGRPRGIAFDRDLGARDLVVVATRAQDAGVGRLALSRLGADAAALCELPAATLPRMLAASGFGLTRSLKGPVGRALGGLE